MKLPIQNLLVDYIAIYNIKYILSKNNYDL